MRRPRTRSGVDLELAGGRLGVRERVGERAARVGRDLELAVPLAFAVPSASAAPTCASAPWSLPPLATASGHVGRDVRASSPVTRLAGISGSALSVAGSTCARRAGCPIWRWTMPWNVVEPNPSWRARANAWSRFGPVTPLVPARLRMWQEPHLATELLLAVDDVVAPVAEALRSPRGPAAADHAGAQRQPRTVLLTIGAES